MVPGSYPQVEEDLLSFPAPVLNALNNYGVRVAVLDQGETLADSPALRHLSEEEYKEQRALARTLTLQELKNTDETSLLGFAEATTRVFRKAGLDFHFGIARRDVTPEYIATRQKIPAENMDDWKAALAELNQGFPPGLYILPHVYDQGKPIPENQIRSARETTAEYVGGALGLNRPEDRLVLLHQKYTAAKAPEIGNYRLVLHEMGHALDHLLDRTTGIPGFGALHRQTVDALYQRDLERAEAEGVSEVFTTTRASENVREYFAEAVEAYLTHPNDDGGDIFRAANSKPGLLAKNEELYNYVDRVMTSALDQSPPPPPPGRPLLPDFVPDPDAAVINL